MKWWVQMPWSSFSECWVLRQLFHSSFTFIKRLFSSTLLSAIRVVSSAYLIPACASSSLAFHMVYSACKSNKHGNNIQPWHTPFPILNQSVVPCPVLAVTSWSTYVSQEAGKVVWYSLLFKNFPQFVVIHTVKGLCVVNEYMDIIPCSLSIDSFHF